MTRNKPVHLDFCDLRTSRIVQNHKHSSIESRGTAVRMLLNLAESVTIMYSPLLTKNYPLK